MSRRSLGILLVLFGGLLVLIAALADVIGIGGGGAFGSRQIAGVAVGALAVVLGALVVLRTRKT